MNFLLKWGKYIAPLASLFLTHKAKVLKATTKKSNYKKRDNTKFTKHHFDFIMYAYAEWQKHNRECPHDKRSMKVLISVINSVMKTDKSRTAISMVWQGHVDRNTLEDGEKYFTY